MLGVYPLPAVVAGRRLLFATVGNVATHPYETGRGYMRRLMDAARARLDEMDADASRLGGLRRRYAPFGYEPVVDIRLTGVEPGTGTNPPSLLVDLRATYNWGGPIWADYRRMAWVFAGTVTPANWKSRVPVTAVPLFSSPS